LEVRHVRYVDLSRISVEAIEAETVALQPGEQLFFFGLNEEKHWMYLGTKVSVFLGEYGREWQDVFVLRGQRPGGAPGTLVVVHASKWIVYDGGNAAGRLTAGAEELRKETGRRKEPDGVLPKKLMAASQCKVRTPFAYDDYGRPMMDDAAEQWFHEACRKREGLAEEIQASAGNGHVEVPLSLRLKWRRILDKEPWFGTLWDQEPEKFREAEDGAYERYVQDPKTKDQAWVPVVPSGSCGTCTWREWVFTHSHVGVFGGHRNVEQTVHILHRVAWWPDMKKHVREWVDQCMTCIRFRKRPVKQEAVAVKPRDAECWEEVMIDMEGPSNPADKSGNRYVMSYVCCLCHGVLFEPGQALTHSEVRRMFARCVFRAGTIPRVVRSDRGPEFKNVLMAEYTALLGIRQRFGTAWRPMEQGIVERCHQELQKLLGMLVLDVTKSFKSEWTELLPVVEFLIYNTPGPHGYTPRDLDRRWSAALPIAKELQPFQVLDFEPVSEYAKDLFAQYRTLKAKVVGWYAETSEKRATLANRFRREKVVVEGDRVVYRDPRAKAVGGRTPWKEPLSDPCVVENASGNKLSLRRADGVLLRDVHVEDVVLLPRNTQMLESREPIEMSPAAAVGAVAAADTEARRSIGEMLEAAMLPEQPVSKPMKLGKLDKLTVGMHIAYTLDRKAKVCLVGKIKTVTKTEACVVVHKHKAVSDGRLRLTWKPLFTAPVEQGGAESLEEGAPVLDRVGVKDILSDVELHDGVMSHAAARKLDRAGWRFEQIHEYVLAARPEGAGKIMEEFVQKMRCVFSVEERPEDTLRRGSVNVHFTTRKAFQQWYHKVRVGFLEIYCGYGELTSRVREAGMTAGDGIDSRVISYGQTWPLEEERLRAQLAWLVVYGLRPHATHTGTPCTHMCVVGQRQDAEHTDALNEISREIALFQQKRNSLASNEQPEGSNLPKRNEWMKSFGTVDQAKWPWRYFKACGCQLGLVCPGHRLADRSDGAMGKPIQKAQVWLANFDLSPLALRCRDGAALEPVTHQHERARGSVKLPEGRWIDVAGYTGRYTPVLGTLYARALAAALAERRGTEGPDVPYVPETPLAKRAAKAGAFERPPRGGAGSGPGRAGVAVTMRGGPIKADNDGFTVTPVIEYPVLAGKKAQAVEQEEEPEGEILEPEMSAAERSALADALRKESAAAAAQWKNRADDKQWDTVQVDLSVYDYSGEEVKEDPRRTEEYRQRVVAGLGFDDPAKRPDLSAADVAVVAEVLRRKAGAFWLEGSPRTTVRFVQHDTVPTGPPVRVPPHNLKGEAAQWIDDKLEEEVRRGQLERGNSPWGSPPFPTKEFAEHRRQRKRRIVVDYRRVNARTRRSVYYVRPAAGVVADAAGSVWMTLLDAVTGFNHIVNTDRARKMLAILARSGQFLPRCLTFGPHNGPEDFCYVIDRFYSPGKRSKRRYCTEWLAYVDDLTIRTGRVHDGVWFSDQEHVDRIKQAARAAARTEPQDASEALEAQGFLPKGLGQEVTGKQDRIKRGAGKAKVKAKAQVGRSGKARAKVKSKQGQADERHSHHPFAHEGRGRESRGDRRELRHFFCVCVWLSLAPSGAFAFSHTPPGCWPHLCCGPLGRSPLRCRLERHSHSSRRGFSARGAKSKRGDAHAPELGTGSRIWAG